MAAHRDLLAAGFLGTVTLVASTLAAGPALSHGEPDNRFSTCDLVLVGNGSGAPIGGAPAGFDVNVRSVNNAPMPGAMVTLDFSATTIRLGSVQAPGTTIDCAARTLSRLTNAAGTVNFAARLGGFDNANAVLVIIPDGGPPLQVKARSMDIDGLDGRTGLSDLSLFSANFLNNPAAQETDFDLNGTTGLGDHLLFAAEFLDPVAMSYCP